MLLMIFPLLLLGLGLLLGGRTAHLVALPLRWKGFVAGAFAVQWIVLHLPETLPQPLIGGLLSASYGLLLAFFAVNYRVPGLRLALAGTLLNCLVIVANGGFMPVTPETVHAAGLAERAPLVGERLPGSKDLVLAADRTHLGWLGDRFTLSWPRPQVFSIGDVILVGGLGWLVLGGMQTPWPAAGRQARRRAQDGQGA
ncbi:MAG TPA: DUF5317 domain-containing protein [Chloroflexia bacterium]|nr:DUF5317 domain-containing protein [Chloroflexia bacterium]